jgi:hypothetical protein
LISIGTSTSLLETEAGCITIPNEILINEEVLILSVDEDAG